MATNGRSTTVGARPQESCHKKPSPETPRMSVDFWHGDATGSIATPSGPKEIRAPRREARRRASREGLGVGRGRGHRGEAEEDEAWDQAR